MKKRDPELVIDIPRARFLLGEHGEALTDEQIRRLILHMDDLAKLIIEMHKVQKSNQPLDFA